MLKKKSYQDNQVWFALKGSFLYLGLTSVGLDEIGEIENLSIPELEDDFVKGEVIMSLSGEQGSIDLVAPATGILRELNQDLANDPDAIFQILDQENWVLKLEIEDPTELADLDSQAIENPY